MGMGLPILMAVPEGEATGIVRETGCGLVVEPENPEAIAAAIVNMADDHALMKKLKVASYRAAIVYSRDAMADKMIESFAKLVPELVT